MNNQGEFVDRTIRFENGGKTVIKVLVRRDPDGSIIEPKPNPSERTEADAEIEDLADKIGVLRPRDIGKIGIEAASETED